MIVIIRMSWAQEVPAAEEPSRRLQTDPNCELNGSGGGGSELELKFRNNIPLFKKKYGILR
jgi:hypothetical protein